jgi:hypothetical protein
MRNPLVPRWLCQLALPFAFGVLGARADEISSVYTSLNLEQCRDITPEDAKDYATVWRCKGYGGIDVRVAEGDLRIYVSYGPKAEQQTAARETLPQFNTIGETLEWRLKREGGRLTPFATILRYKWDSDAVEGSTLVVTRLGKDDTCHVAYVEAAGNAKANEQAREIADRDASSFVCKRDRAKHYGADGTLLTDDQ